MTTGHQRGTIASTFLSAADTGAHVQNTLGLQFLVPPGRILMFGVTAIDDDVALRDQRKQLVDKIIDRTAGCNGMTDGKQAIKLATKSTAASSIIMPPRDCLRLNFGEVSPCNLQVHAAVRAPTTMAAMVADSKK